MDDRIELGNGDYVLVDGAAWFTVKGAAVLIRSTDEGVAVHIYRDGKEDEDSVASAYAFDRELAEEE